MIDLNKKSLNSQITFFLNDLPPNPIWVLFRVSPGSNSLRLHFNVRRQMLFKAPSRSAKVPGEVTQPRDPRDRWGVWGAEGSLL